MKNYLTSRILGWVWFLLGLLAWGFVLSVDWPKPTSVILSGPNPQHLLGTDQAGRDTMILALCAARVTIKGVVVALVTALVIGITAGILMTSLRASFFRRVLGSTATVIDMTGPLLPAAALVSIFPKVSVGVLAFLLGSLSWPAVAGPLTRLLDDLMVRPYVQASKVLGATKIEQVRTHLLMPTFALLLPLSAALGSGYLAILASLQFLGAFSSVELNLGNLFYEALTRLQQAPWCLAGALLGFGIALLAIKSLGFAWSFLMNREAGDWNKS